MSKILVAYFSAGGVTANIAKSLSNSINADIFEISPEIPYSKADLDWTDKNSRSSIETSDKFARPAIKNSVDNISQYDIIFLGFPIWWYVAPKIICTFLESYNLNDKVIIPFATSGGSDMGKTNSMLAQSCNGAVLIEGKRFDQFADNNELKKWAEKYID